MSEDQSWPSWLVGINHAHNVSAKTVDNIGREVMHLHTCGLSELQEFHLVEYA